MTFLPNPGEILAGKYAIDHVLGRGGMGVVVAGRHLQLGHRVAIKFLDVADAQHPEAGARFLREARAAVQIQSEHVARVIDVGTAENGVPYIVMEFLSGSDLGQLLAQRDYPFAVEEAVAFVLQACEAIAEAHSLGIVHRDLKPANLFLTRRVDGSPLVKVLDFGISKVLPGHGTDANITDTAAVMGSPAYMAPEQIRSAKDVDRRSDIWAVGMILYELLAGRPAFEAETAAGLLAQIIADPPLPLRALRPDVPAQLETIIGNCLEKDPARRPANIAELSQALLPFSPGSQVSVDRVRRVVQGTAEVGPPEVWPGAHQRPAQAPTGDAWGSTAAERKAGRRRWFLAGAIAVVLSVIVAAYYELGAPETGPEANANPLVSASAAMGTPSAAPIPEPSPPLREPAAVGSTVDNREVPPAGPATKPGSGSSKSKSAPRTSPPARTPAPTATVHVNKDLFDDIN